MLLGAFARLRFGELGALTRERVDLDAGTVAVTEAAIETGGGHREMGEPKTEKGRRAVALPPQIVTELRSAHGPLCQWGPGALVFVGPKGGPLRRANFHTVWAPARRP